MNCIRQPQEESYRRGIELLRRGDYRLMESEAECDEIFRLRYRAYLREGAIEPNAAQRTSDRFDYLPNTWIFGVYVDGELLSSIRVSVGSPRHRLTPSTDVFPDLLNPELDQNKIIVDPTRFVADPERANRLAELPYLTVRLGYVACSHFDADIGLASVRAEHRAFYRRVFLQTPLSPPRHFPGLLKPVCLMAANYPDVRARIFARYPYFRSTDFERRMLFERRDPAVAHSPGAMPAASADLRPTSPSAV